MPQPPTLVAPSDIIALLDLRDFADAIERAGITRIFVQTTEGTPKEARRLPAPVEAVETLITLTASPGTPAPLFAARTTVEKATPFLSGDRGRLVYEQVQQRHREALALLKRWLYARLSDLQIDPGMLVRPGTIEEFDKIESRQHLWRVGQPERDKPESRQLVSLWPLAQVEQPWPVAPADQLRAEMIARLLAMPLDSHQTLAGTLVYRAGEDDFNVHDEPFNLERLAAELAEAQQTISRVM